MTATTLDKYLGLLEVKAREIIKAMLSPTFSLIIDVWTIDSHHYSAIFATLYTLNMMLFLKANRHLWPDACIFQFILKEYGDDVTDVGSDNEYEDICD